MKREITKAVREAFEKFVTETATVVKEDFSPKERVGIAFQRMCTLLYGDSSTHWQPILGDEMDDTAKAALEGIVEILTTAMGGDEDTKARKQAMSEDQLGEHSNTELEKAGAEMKAGKQGVARKRLAHLKSELAKARTAFEGGADSVEVTLFDERAATKAGAKTKKAADAAARLEAEMAKQNETSGPGDDDEEDDVTDQGDEDEPEAEAGAEGASVKTKKSAGTCPQCTQKMAGAACMECGYVTKSAEGEESWPDDMAPPRTVFKASKKAKPSATAN